MRIEGPSRHDRRYGQSYPASGVSVDAARLCYDRSPSPGEAGHALASHHLPERPSRICADTRRELPARRRRAAGLHRGRFRQRRRRPDSARHRHVDEPARVADARSRAHAARVAGARRADDHRLVGRHRRQQPRRSLRADHQGARREASAAALQARLLLFGGRQGGPAAAHARRRNGRGTRGASGADRGGARRHRANRRDGRRPSVHRAARGRAPT